MTYPVVLSRYYRHQPLTSYTVHETHLIRWYEATSTGVYVSSYEAPIDTFELRCGGAIMDCLADPQMGGEIVVRVAHADWHWREIVYNLPDEVSHMVFLCRYGEGLPRTC